MKKSNNKFNGNEYQLFACYNLCGIYKSKNKLAVDNKLYPLFHDKSPQLSATCYRTSMKSKFFAKCWFEHADIHLNHMLYPNDNNIVIYTDGSCRKDRAAYGVWFGLNDFRNTALAVPGLDQTSQHAEILAVIKALELAGYSIKPNTTNVYIYSDYIYLAQAFQRYHNLFRSQYFERFDGAVERFRSQFPSVVLNIEYVPAHSGIYGNEQADKLAKSVYSC